MPTKMDAAEDDRDIKLQKLSSTFIADFELSLHPFLYRTTADGTSKVRRNVRAREVDRLVGLVPPHFTSRDAQSADPCL